MAASMPTGGASLMNVPAAAPPPGSKPNFLNPTSLARSIIVINTVFLSLMIVVVVIRFISKRFIVHQKYNLSDATCIVATLGSIVHTCLAIIATTRGFGRHQYDMRLTDLMPPTPKIYSSIDIVYVITTYFVKISLLLLFWQFFSVMTGARRAIIFGLGFVTIFNIPYVIVSCLRVAQCHEWWRTICSNHVVGITNIVFGSFNVFTDFFILAIPVSQIKKLNIPSRRKIGVLFTFLIGFIACSMSIVRLGIVAKNFGSTDGLWTAATVARYSAVEMKLAIICSCVVHLPAFFKQSKTSLSSAYMTMTRRGGGSSNNDLPEKPSNDSLRNNAILVKSAPRGIIERELADLDTFESR